MAAITFASVPKRITRWRFETGLVFPRARWRMNVWDEPAIHEVRHGVAVVQRPGLWAYGQQPVEARP